jgi:hypothetical protein
MEQKWSELPDRAWISRLWAHYSKLPESFKGGFFKMAQYLAQENANEKTAINGPVPGILENNGGDYKT